MFVRSHLVSLLTGRAFRQFHALLEHPNLLPLSGPAPGYQWKVDKRWSTWAWGLFSLAVVIFTGLTGFLLQTSWDSQWIAVQAKDAMNAMGIGAFFNTLNTGQVLTLHIAVLPLVAVIFIGIHLFLVRRDGPVKPLPTGTTRPPMLTEPLTGTEAEAQGTGRAKGPDEPTV